MSTGQGGREGRGAEGGAAWGGAPCAVLAGVRAGLLSMGPRTLPRVPKSPFQVWPWPPSVHPAVLTPPCDPPTASPPS